MFRARKQICSIVIHPVDKSPIPNYKEEFTALNPETGIFQIVPEYPVFAWLEGIVNAITHKEYGMFGTSCLF